MSALEPVVPFDERVDLYCGEALCHPEPRLFKKIVGGRRARPGLLSHEQVESYPMPVASTSEVICAKESRGKAWSGTAPGAAGANRTLGTLGDFYTHCLNADNGYSVNSSVRGGQPFEGFRRRPDSVEVSEPPCSLRAPCLFS